MTPVFGAKRAVVAATDDTEERRRFRVRVYGVHSEDLPITHLPWAECCFIGGGGWGDYPFFEVGDRVIVIAEDGNRENWFIIGGWIASPKGQPDLPPELTGDYAADLRRWVKIDKAGNMIEFSAVDDELHVRLKSGNAELVISQKDDSVVIEAAGPLSITANKTSIVSQVTELSCPEVNITGDGVEGTTETGQVNIFSNKDMTIFAGVGATVPTQDGKGHILVGQYKDGLGVARQTDKIEVLPNILNLGEEAGPVPPLTANQYLHTDEINLQATTKVTIKSTEGLVQIDAKTAAIHITEDATVTVDRDATIEIGNDATINVGNILNVDVTDAANVTIGGDLTADVTGAANLTVGGDALVDATGKADIKAGADVTIDAAGKAVVLGASGIELGSGALGNVVTTLHPCAFTGAPHPAGSSLVKAVQ
jgi:hypothetical protein